MGDSPSAPDQLYHWGVSQVSSLAVAVPGAPGTDGKSWVHTLQSSYITYLRRNIIKKWKINGHDYFVVVEIYVYCIYVILYDIICKYR